MAAVTSAERAGIGAGLVHYHDDELRRGIQELMGDVREGAADWLAGHGVAQPEDTAADVAPVLRGLFVQ